MSCEAYSKAHCSHFYCLDKVVVDMIADSSTTNVIDFCKANPNLHQFSLTCRTEDCEEIISIVNNNALTNRQKKYAHPERDPDGGDVPCGRETRRANGVRG